jgi:YHS domain-containing protein
VGWLTRAIVILVVVWALWRLLRGVLEGAGLLGQGSPRAPGVKLERDPVCGVFVAPSAALVARARGETAYFCSEKCRQQWEKNR